MESTRTFDPETLSPTECYKLLTGLVVPRPIGWIGSVSATGHHNLAPYSFFNVVSAHPPTIMFSSDRSARLKDTLTNVLDTEEFTVNIVTEEVAEAMNVTAGEYGAEVDEFEVAGLIPVFGRVVSAPMVAEATARFECRVRTHLHVGPDGGEPSNTVVFGEVQAFHVADRVLDGTRIDAAELRAIGRLAGSSYTRTSGALFEMVRP